jgi:hypothetical protein
MDPIHSLGGTRTYQQWLSPVHRGVESGTAKDYHPAAQAGIRTIAATG